MGQVAISFLITFFFGQYWNRLTMATWMDTFSKCPSGLEFDRNVLAKNTDLYGQEFWIGSIVNETVEKTWVEIQGCDKMDHIDEQFSSPLIDLCSFECSPSVYFGYINSLKMCICLGIENPRTIRNVTLCAMEDNCSNCVVMYKRITEIQIKPSINGGSCITARCLNGTPEFKQDGCFSSDGNQNKCNVGNKNISWTNSLDECILQRYSRTVLLESLNDTCTNSNNLSYFWTNIISVKTYVPLNINKSSSFDPTLLFCASGFIQDNTIQIRHRNCSDNVIVFVCRMSETTTLKTKDTVQIISGSSFGIIAGCVVGILLAMAVIIMLVFRIRPSCIYKTSKNNEITLQELSNTVNEKSTAETTRSRINTNISVDRKQKAAEIHPKQVISVHDKTRDYEDYDHLHQTKDNTIARNENTYDTSYFKSITDPMYNTAGIECRRLEDKIEMYDHI